jgi:hypothetical protein
MRGFQGYFEAIFRLKVIAMMSSGMRESSLGVVKVTDTPYEIFLHLVEYLYTSQISENIRYLRHFSKN